MAFFVNITNDDPIFLNEYNNAIICIILKITIIAIIVNDNVDESRLDPVEISPNRPIINS